MSEENKNMPVGKQQAGQLSVTTWENEVTKKDGSIFTEKSFNLKKSYSVEENGNTVWKETSSLKTNDIPKAILCLQKAYEEAVLKK